MKVNEYINRMMQRRRRVSNPVVGACPSRPCPLPLPIPSIRRRRGSLFRAHRASRCVPPVAMCARVGAPTPQHANGSPQPPIPSNPTLTPLSLELRRRRNGSHLFPKPNCARAAGTSCPWLSLRARWRRRFRGDSGREARGPGRRRRSGHRPVGLFLDCSWDVSQLQLRPPASALACG